MCNDYIQMKSITDICLDIFTLTKLPTFVRKEEVDGCETIMFYSMKNYIFSIDQSFRATILFDENDTHYKDIVLLLKTWFDCTIYIVNRNLFELSFIRRQKLEFIMTYFS